MTDKPKVLDWHRAAAEEWHGVLRYQNRLAEIIAAHDPHADLQAEVARLTADRNVAINKLIDYINAQVFSPTERETGLMAQALSAEVERLRKALERIVEMHCCTECEIDRWGNTKHGSECPATIAAAALEGKDGD